MDSERNRLILDIAIEGFWDWDLQADRAYLSPRYCEMIGYSPDDTIFDSAFLKKVIHPDDYQRVYDVIQGHLQGSPIHNTEYRLVSRDGSVRWVENRSRIVAHDEQGRPSRMVGAIIDITDRKQVEEKLQESENFSQAFMDNNPAVAWMKDEQFRFVYVNKKFEKQFGVRFADMQGKTDFELLPHEIAAEYRRNDMAILEEGKPREFIEKVVNNDGTLSLWLNNKFIFQNTAHKRFIGGIGLDITERNKTRVELERYGRLFRYISDMVIVVGNDGFVQTSNPAFASTLGYSDEELRSRPFFDFVHPDDRQRTLKELELQAQGQLETLNFQNRYLCKDNSHRWFSWNAFYDEEKQLFYGIARDITEQKQVAEELFRTKETLERQVQERTISLSDTNDKLRREVDERIRVEQNLLNNQQKLKVMSLELSLATERERGRIAEELHDHVGQRLVLSRIKLDALANQLACYGQEQAFTELVQLTDQTIKDIRSLTFQLRPPVLANAGLLAAVRWLGEEFMANYGFLVAVEHDGSSINLSYETASFLYQMIRELLLNVIKHAKTDCATVNITRKAPSLSITVADRGIGFDPTNVLANNEQNAGFGIFNIQQRIEHLGGMLQIESQPGEGSRVTVSVPIDGREIL